MTDYLFAPPPPAALAVAGAAALYPVRRIFCVGRNYAAHAAEMGGTVDREAPWYFLKSAAHLLPAGADLPYPPGTADLHHEVELAVALDAGGRPFAYAVALDMTRRDLQAQAKDQRRPWDTAKDFEGAAVIGLLDRDFRPEAQEIALRVDGVIRQRAPISDMVWDIPALIAHLGGLYALGAGDVILTGTPAGVGAVKPGQRISAGVAGLAPLELTVV